MKKSHVALTVAGLVVMLLAVVIPLEGWPLVFAGCGLCTAAAYLAQSKRVKLIGGGMALVAVGAVAMIVLTLFGGVGGTTGRSELLMLLVVPYPLGWVMALVGSLMMLVTKR